MSRGRLHPEVSIKIGSKKFIVYGREYGYDPSSLADKARALTEAETYGKQCIDAFEKRVQRPASLRETLTLKADAPPPTPYSGSLRKDTPVVNPFRQRMGDISKWSEVHSWQRDRKQRRLELLERQADAWDAKQSVVVQDSARVSSPDYVRAMQHADKRIDDLRLDPAAPQSALESAVQAQQDLERGTISPGEFFQTMNAPPPADHKGNLYVA